MEKEVLNIINMHVKESSDYKNQVLFIANKIGDKYSFKRGKKVLSKVSFLTELKSFVLKEEIKTKEDLISCFKKFLQDINLKEY